MNMIKEKAKADTPEMLSEGIFSMYLKTGAAGSAKPGQFVMINTRDGAHLLGRPISICDIDPSGGRLRLVWRVAGYGTEEFSRLKAGEEVELLGPLGNGFDTAQALNAGQIAVIGGGIGAPPLLGFVKALKEKDKKEINIYLGYRSASAGLFLAEEFKNYGNVFIATDDGSAGTHGTVLDALKESAVKPSAIYACGPMPMLKGIKAYCEEALIPAYISLEERMACGVGACLGCVVKTRFKDEHSKVENARICTEGPVFAAKDVDI